VRIEKLTVLLFNVVLGVPIRRPLSLVAMSGLAVAFVLGGCGPAMTRAQRDRSDLEKLRATDDEQSALEARRILGRLLERTKAEYDKSSAGGRKEAPVIDILIISGGGDWGAFGAGFLKGWKSVSAQTRWRCPSSTL
jgi:hypothetical protein